MRGGALRAVLACVVDLRLWRSRGLRALAAVALSACGADGCGHPAIQRVERVAVAADGTVWLSGTEGFAARGRGAELARADYPRDGRHASHAYEQGSGGIPVASVVFLDGRTYLVSRPGDVYRRDADAWTRLDVDMLRLFQQERYVQIDAALVTPEGRLALHEHYGRLGFATGAELERGALTVEATPGYLTWVGVLRGKLHGLGWAGDLRTLVARDGPTAWRTLAQLPRDAGDPFGAIELADHAVAAVTSRGLVAVDTDGQLSVRPLLDLARGASPRVVQQAAGAAPLDDAPPRASGTSTGAAVVAPPAPPPRASGPRPLQVAADPGPPQAEAPAAIDASSFVTAAFASVGGRGPFLVVNGSKPALLELSSPPRVHVCEALVAPAGVLPGGDGALRVVLALGAVVELDAAGCRVARGDLVRDPP